ncbi:MAG: TolC family protein [Gemmatimonadales bacterium]|nr:TolC family protein [Gemmatimonadales bacterium]
MAILPMSEAFADIEQLVVARPGPTEPLDLSSCVEEALQANEFLSAERLRMSELHGQMKQALSTGLPTLDFVGDWTRSRDPSMALDSTFGGSGDAFLPPPTSEEWFLEWLSGFGSLIPPAADIPSQSFLRANLNLNWTVNPWKIKGAIGAASLGIDRQEQAIRSSENRTAEQTITSYYGIIQAAEKVAAVRAQILDQRELLNILQMRHELGMVTRLDTLQAAVSLANLRPLLGIAEAGLRNAGAQLNAILGRDAEAPLSLLDEGEVETDSIDQGTALELAVNRPELLAQDRFTDILRRNRQAQIAESRPYLTFGGAYGYVGTSTGDLFNEGHDSWRTSVALNWSPFDGLLTRGRVAETNAMIRRSEVELSGNRRTVQVEVLQLLANLEMARELLAAVQLNLVRSEEALDETMLMLELGKASYLDVLVAQSNRAQALGSVIDARYEVFSLTASLKRSLGWSPLVPLVEIPDLVPEVVQ